MTVEAKSITRHGEATTTDATLTTALTIAIPDNTVFTAYARVHGQRADGTKYGTYELRYQGYRNAGGNVTSVTGTSAIYSNESDAALNAAIGGSGTNLLVQVQGLAANTFIWIVEVELTYSPNS